MKETKRCTKCGKIKPLAEFHVRSDRKSGRRSACKTCSNAKSIAYHQENREQVLARQARHRESHREEENARSRIYRDGHKEEIRVRNRAYQEAHKEDLAAKRRTYYQENCEQLKAKSAAFREEHRNECAASNALWRQTPAGRASIRAKHHNRRVREGKPLVKDVIEEVIADAKGICAYCNGRIEPGTGHIDHIVPIAKGGVNERINLIYVCRGCNLSKGPKSLLEFANYQRGIEAAHV